MSQFFFVITKLLLFRPKRSANDAVNASVARRKTIAVIVRLVATTKAIRSANSDAAKS